MRESWKQSSTTPQSAHPEHFRVSHPFHPLCGQKHELVALQQHWDGCRVLFHDTAGRLRSLPVKWTDLVPEDPFVVIAAGRSLFQVEELLVLVGLVREFSHDQ
ncbi:MAG: hypothetical protein KAY24_11170 [Candidatus Eisenbacteria sp.]|nr:hypothetical protein [Candidatus Eisenbacteria bacterium]